LWWGSLSVVGFGVVPMLFAYLPTPALAGNMAAHLFTAQSALGVVCGLVLLLIYRANSHLPVVITAWGAPFTVVAGVLLALLLELAVAPHIVARENLRLWHSVGTLMYALQWLCAGWVLARCLRAPG
jgi:hypothetical protein